MTDGLREQAPPYDQDDLAPPDYVDPVIEAYKRDVDRTLLRKMLKLTPQQRSEKFASLWNSRMKCALPSKGCELRSSANENRPRQSPRKKQ